ncbi:MAG: molybdopterin-dependent oxidoreductase [Betaproteobacteria bacterium]|nr:molybdopterin-dependent oxidoreductase [Betaproteobacteria bacterium]
MNAPPRKLGSGCTSTGRRRGRGAAVFTHDVELPHMLQGAILRSPHAHAWIRAIDTAAARALPGVHAVITAADFPGQRYLHLGVRYADRHPLAVDKVRFYGEEVAAVAADSAALARQALALIAVNYEPLPAALTPEAALRADAPEVHDGVLTAAGRNIAIRFACDYGDVVGAFSVRAPRTCSRTSSRTASWCRRMETNGTVARFDPVTGQLTLWTATQAPFFVRKEVAHVLGLDIERVHIRGVEVGGGFGEASTCEQEATAARLSIATGRPVKPAS